MYAKGVLFNYTKTAYYLQYLQPNYEELVAFVEEKTRVVQIRYGRLAQRSSKSGKRSYENQVNRRDSSDAVRHDISNSAKFASYEFCLSDHVL